MSYKILIEGCDLVGKTTTTGLLVKRLEQLGLRVEYRKGRIYDHAGYRWLRRVPPWNHPTSRLLNACYFVAALVETGFARSYELWQRGRPSDCDIVVCESHVDRSIAYRQAFLGGYRRDRWFIRWSRWLMRFDLAVILYANPATRRERLTVRPSDQRNTVDDVTVAGDSEVFYKTLRTIMRRHHRMVEIDTAVNPIESVLAKILDALGHPIPTQVSNGASHVRCP